VTVGREDELGSSLDPAEGLEERAADVAEAEDADPHEVSLS
jgi:hypothetical protein